MISITMKIEYEILGTLGASEIILPTLSLQTLTTPPPTWLSQPVW